MAYAVEDKLVMLATLQVKPERLEAFLAYTSANLSVSRAYPGNLQFEMLLAADQPNTVRFYEAWESVAAQQAYMAWRVAAGDLTTLMSFLETEPDFQVLSSVAA